MSKIDYAHFEKILKELSSDEDKRKVIKYKIDWNQSRKAVRVEIQLQPGEGKKENVDVVFKSEYLFATVKTAKRPIIEGPLFEKIRPDQCNWWLEKDKLFLEIEKAIEGLDWDEVIVKPNVRSNKIDHEERKRKERQAKEMERRKTEEEERRKKGAPTVSEALVNAMGPMSYPPREKHRPYKDNKEDEFLFQVD